MKSSRKYIVVALMMLCNFIFTQLVIDFFHEHHTISLVNDQETLHEGYDKCKVCDLNISHELFEESIFEFVIFSNNYSPESLYQTLSIKNSLAFYIGRSPPIEL